MKYMDFFRMVKIRLNMGMLQFFVFCVLCNRD
ncbi:hypothetical protein F383_04879 [Gossypium arboreum]|uniref:Uncharacterized protein n=1 Tax=Gossypium arboreum TaxID=29729 RepID=A0A0B0PFM5_GOSAR|nr:hypothetical protein F383_04879 [Gossypium arboreum]